MRELNKRVKEKKHEKLISQVKKIENTKMTLAECSVPLKHCSQENTDRYL